MKTFYVAELQNLSSTRKAEEITANSVAGAKRAASQYQTFMGTTLKLMDENGYLIAVKEHGAWKEPEFRNPGPEMYIA